MLSALLTRLRRLAQRRRAAPEMDDELGFRQTTETIRGARFWFDSVVHDARYAARTFLKAPTFTTVAILTLSLCIGANTALFSVVDAVLLRPLPYEQAGELYSIRSTYKGVRGEYVSYSDFAAWRSGARSLSHMAAIRGDAATISTASGPEYIGGAEVSEDFFTVFRVKPLQGRTFTASEHKRGGPRVVLLGHNFWVTKFAGDLRVIGKTVLVDGDPHAVVGVLPTGFAFPEQTEFWRPLTLTESGAVLRVVARLRPGVRAAVANTQLTDVSRQLERLHPERRQGWGVSMTPLLQKSTERVRLTLHALWGAVACVLLIGCANVGILLLSRGFRRAHELTLRSALGATRCRLVQQLLAESVLLALVGGAGGVLVARWSIVGIRAWAPADTPRLQEVSLDLPVLCYALAISLGVGILAGVVPAWKGVRANSFGSVRAGWPAGRFGRHRGMHTLAIAQIVVTLVLLIGAGLMVRTLERLHDVKLGFNPDRLLTFYVSLPDREYRDEAKVRGFYLALLHRLRTLPGVESASAINALFIHWGKAIVVPVPVEGRPAPAPSDSPDTHIRLVDPDLHRVLQIPIVRGRSLTSQDGRQGSLSVVINQTMAKRYFPAEDPIGRRILVAPGWSEIIGVVGDVRQNGLDEDVQPEVQIPITQSAITPMAILVRAAGDPLALLPAVRGEVRRLDPNLPLTYIQTMEEVLGKSLAGRRFGMTLLSMFACFALMLTAIGVYAVMAATAHERTHEIGVRLALGASQQRVLTTVVGQMAAVALAGVVIGTAATVAIVRYLEPLLFGVPRTDPVTYVVGGLVVLAAATGSGYLPARRAVRVDPATTLRAE